MSRPGGPGPIVFVTRPAGPRADALAAQLAAAGYAPVSAPTHAIVRRERVAPSDLGDADAVVFTSAPAVAAVAEDAPGAARPKAYAVGAATAEAARRAGFSEVVVGLGDGAALAEAIQREASPATRIFYPHGAHLATDLFGLLSAAGFSVHGREVYAAEALPALPAPARSALAEPDGAAALFLSARAAEQFAHLAGASRARIWAVCSSARIAEAAGGHLGVTIATRPTAAACLSALIAARPPTVRS